MFFRPRRRRRYTYVTSISRNFGSAAVTAPKQRGRAKFFFFYPNNLRVYSPRLFDLLPRYRSVRLFFCSLCIFFPVPTLCAEHNCIICCTPPPRIRFANKPAAVSVKFISAPNYKRDCAQTYARAHVHALGVTVNVLITHQPRAWVRRRLRRGCGGRSTNTANFRAPIGRGALHGTRTRLYIYIPESNKLYFYFTRRVFRSPSSAGHIKQKIY